MDSTTVTTKLKPRVQHCLVTLSIEGGSSEQIAVLLGLFFGSPLRRITIGLKPGVKVKDCAELYRTFQHFKGTLQDVSFTMEGSYLCDCDRFVSHDFVPPDAPLATYESNSDEMWLKVQAGERIESCHPEEDAKWLANEMMKLVLFAHRKLKLYEKQGDEAGLWEFARWMITLRGRKLLEEI